MATTNRHCVCTMIDCIVNSPVGQEGWEVMPLMQTLTTILFQRTLDGLSQRFIQRFRMSECGLCIVGLGTNLWNS